jgi:hypothetical protein
MSIFKNNRGYLGPAIYMKDSIANQIDGIFFNNSDNRDNNGLFMPPRFLFNINKKI